MDPAILQSLFAGGQEAYTHDITSILYLFGQSFVLGLIISYVTYLTLTPMLQHASHEKNVKTFLSMTNILFLCLGLTGIMILINNNLARALSIGATLRLVRFRLKLGSKSLGSNLFFSILAGVSCGLNEPQIGWITTLIYILVQALIYLVLKKMHKKDQEKKQIKNQEKNLEKIE